MNLLRLTDPDGSAVYIVAQWVTKVRKALSSETGNTTVFTGHDFISVQESLDEVVNWLRTVKEE